VKLIVQNKYQFLDSRFRGRLWGRVVFLRAEIVILGAWHQFYEKKHTTAF
jgi:hypothetical protein